MRRLGGLFAAFLVTASLFGGWSAHATVALKLSVEDMAREAAVVVRAQARAHMSAWDESHRRIYTYTELEVLETWAGEADSTVVVRTLGGEVDGVGMKVSGVARFEDGEEVVLFLRTDPAHEAELTVVGMSQGKLRIAREGEKTLAVPQAGGLVLAVRRGDGRIDMTENAGQAALPIADLRARVETARVQIPTLDQPSTNPATPVTK